MGGGDAFSLSRSAGNFLRFNVAQTSDARLFEVLSRALAEAGVMGVTGVSGATGNGA